MTDAGFFRGATAEQDIRFPDKQKKLLKTLPFPPEYQTKVNMKKVNLNVMKVWIMSKINDILDNEDEILENFVLNQLECMEPDPRHIQINLTGFLNAKNAREFVCQLWKLLLEAQSSPDGIPMSLVHERVKLERELSHLKSTKTTIKSEPVDVSPPERAPKATVAPVTSPKWPASSPKRQPSPVAATSGSSGFRPQQQQQQQQQQQDRGQHRSSPPRRRSRSRGRWNHDYRSRSRSKDYRQDRSYGARNRYVPLRFRRRSRSRPNSRRSPSEGRYRQRDNSSPPNKSRFQDSRRGDNSSSSRNRREPSPGQMPGNDRRRSPSQQRMGRMWSPIVWSDNRSNADNNDDRRSDGGHFDDNDRPPMDDRGEFFPNRRFNGNKDAGHRLYPPHSPDRMPFPVSDRYPPPSSHGNRAALLPDVCGVQMRNFPFEWTPIRRQGSMSPRHPECNAADFHRGFKDNSNRFQMPFGNDYWGGQRRREDMPADNNNFSPDWRNRERMEPLIDDRFRDSNAFGGDNYPNPRFGFDSRDYPKGGGGAGGDGGQFRRNERKEFRSGQFRGPMRMRRFYENRMKMKARRSGSSNSGDGSTDSRRFSDDDRFHGGQFPVCRRKRHLRRRKHTKRNKNNNNRNSNNSNNERQSDNYGDENEEQCDESDSDEDNEGVAAFGGGRRRSAADMGDNQRGAHISAAAEFPGTSDVGGGGGHAEDNEDNQPEWELREIALQSLFRNRT